jgi:OPA family glycerol-3-phosphate transporter-like MFS transporter/OPA family sugar phosphate sensor protein UhpC-like MFS transporter
MTRRSFGWWQWETLLVTMGGYAVYYFVRKNLSFAMPLLAEIGVSKVQLGAFLTAGGLLYGIARFTNGVLTDRGSARKVMSLGLFVCAAVNVVFGLSDFIVTGGAAPAVAKGATAAAGLVWTMGVVWIVNSYFQGMGVGPCVKTLPRWFPPNQLATKQSIWNLSHSIGAGGVFALLGWWIIPQYHSWRLCFLVPAGIAAAGAMALLFMMKDSPKDVGLAELDGEKPMGGNGGGNSVDYRAYAAKWVYRNPCIWILAASNFFVNVVRFAALDWGPTLLVESKGLTLAAATTLCFSFEIVGGNLGMLAAGWASDRVFASRTHRTCVFCFAGIALAIAAFWAVPSSAPLMAKLVPFALIGFFLYGPQALLGVSSTQQATPKAAATANGVLGVCGYLSTIVSGVGFGWMAQRWGWSAAYATILAAAVMGGLVVLMMWNAPVERRETEE